MKENTFSSARDVAEGEPIKPAEKKKPAGRSVSELPDGSGNDARKYHQGDEDSDRFDAG